MEWLASPWAYVPLGILGWIASGVLAILFCGISIRMIGIKNEKLHKEDEYFMWLLFFFGPITSIIMSCLLTVIMLVKLTRRIFRLVVKGFEKLQAILNRMFMWSAGMR